MSPTTRRCIAGIAALLLSLAWAVFHWGFHDPGAGAMCLRAALVLGAVWLAFPQVMELTFKCPSRLTLGIAAATVILVIRPRAFPLVALLVGALAVLEFVGWFLHTLRQPPPKRRVPPEKRAPEEDRGGS